MDTSGDQTVGRTGTRCDGSVGGRRVIAGVGSDDAVLVLLTRRYTVIAIVVFIRLQKHLVILRAACLTTCQLIVIHASCRRCPGQDDSVAIRALRSIETVDLRYFVVVQVRSVDSYRLQIRRMMYLERGRPLIDTYGILVMHTRLTGYIRHMRHPTTIRLTDDAVGRNRQLYRIARLYQDSLQVDDRIAIPITTGIALVHLRYLALQLRIERMLGCIGDRVLRQEIGHGRLHRRFVFGDMSVEVDAVSRRIEFDIGYVRRFVFELAHEVHDIDRDIHVFVFADHADLHHSAALGVSLYRTVLQGQER